MHKDENQKIAKAWREKPSSDLKWARCDNQAGGCAGEAGGFYVAADGFSRRAYLKPGKPHPDEETHLRAAREKIAADLAFDLGLPVPPAQLSLRDDAPDDCEKAVVITLVMYPVQHDWKTVKSRIVEDNSPQHLAFAKVLCDCAPMLAFDTWVDQTDHNDHPNNIIWGYDAKRPQVSEIIFLDFANSMGHDGRWAGGGWNHDQLAPFPPAIRKHSIEGDVISKAKEIEALDEKSIEDIVKRIPESHLSSEQSEIILEGLLGRKVDLAGKLEAGISSN